MADSRRGGSAATRVALVLGAGLLCLLALQFVFDTAGATAIRYIYESDWTRSFAMRDRDSLTVGFYLQRYAYLFARLETQAALLITALALAWQPLTRRRLGLYLIVGLAVLGATCAGLGSPIATLLGSSSDVFGLLLLGAASGGVLAAWLRFCWSYETLSVSTRISRAIVLSLSQVAGSALLLGVFGRLYRLDLLALNVVVSTGVVAATYRRRRDESQGRRFIARDVLTAFAPLTRTLPNRLLSLLLLGQLGLLFLSNALVEEISGDGIIYHLPMVKLMVQNAHVYDVPVHLAIINTYPKNVELVYLWTALLPGNDLWLNFGQIPFFFLLLLSTYSICRELGCSRESSWFAAASLGFVPVVTTQLETCYIDVAVSSMIVSAVSIVYPLSRRRPLPLDHVSLGLLLALLAGSKGTGPVYAVALGAVYCVFIRWRSGDQLRRAVAATGLALLVGSFWFVKNYLVYGNPVHPYRVAIHSRVIFPGPVETSELYGSSLVEEYGYPALVLASWFSLRDDDGFAYSSLLGGFGPIWPLVFLPAIFALAISSLSRNDLASAGLIGLFAILYLLTPLGFRLRFVIFVLALGAYALAYWLDRARPVVATLLRVVVLLLAAVNGYAYPPNALKIWTAHSKETAASLNPYRESELWQSVNWLHGRVQAGERVGYTDLTPMHFLWNRDISNRVDYLGGASYWGADPVQAGELCEQIARAESRLDYLFLPKSGEGYRCREELESAFAVVYEDDSAWIVRSVPTSSERAAPSARPAGLLLHQLIELGLAQAGEREVGGRIALGAGLETVRHERSQQCQETLRHSLHRLSAVDLTMEDPLDLELARDDRGNNIQKMQPSTQRTPRRANRLTGAGQERARAIDGVEPAEVVEGDLGDGKLREQAARLLVAADIPEQTVGQATLGDGPQLLLHELQSVTRTARAVEVEQNGEHRREPTHGTGDVHSREKRLPAMPLEREPCPPFPRVTREAVDERGDENLVHSRVVRSWCPMQESFRLSRVQRHAQLLQAGDVVRDGCAVARQAGARRRVERSIKLERSRKIPGGGVIEKRPRPDGEGCRLRETHALVLGRVARGKNPLQILEQDAPRDRIDHEVMRDQ